MLDTRLAICSKCIRPVVSAGICHCGKVKEQKQTHKPRVDLDKNCGVIISSTGLPCLRSLTCKSHSLTSKRKVEGRSKPFDDLLKEKFGGIDKRIGEANASSTFISDAKLESVYQIQHELSSYRPVFKTSYSKLLESYQKICLRNIFQDRA